MCSRRARLTALLAVAVAAAVAPAACAAATFIVNTTDDASGTCTPLHCSLRQAITSANATPGTDRIEFAIPPGGLQTITPLSPLPPITDPVAIDATTQPGYSGMPIIELDGSAAGPGATGLLIQPGDSVVRGFVINRFAFIGTAIWLAGGGGNIVQNNFIGTDATGTVAAPNGFGVRVDQSPSNIVGGTQPVDRNIISGNHADGIFLNGAGSFGNVLEGNFIGTDVTGTHGLSNRGSAAVEVQNASDNTVGGTASGARNLISGNSVTRGLLTSGSTKRTLIEGNYVGVDVTGTAPLGNQSGISLFSNDNVVGGTAPGSGNVISANSSNGVGIQSLTASGNVIQGNLIGTDAAGTAALGNGLRGVEVDGPGNTVGGASTAARNVIAGNGEIGVLIAFNTAVGNLVAGNYIGVDVTGSGPLGNLRGASLSRGAMTTRSAALLGRRT